MSPYAAVCNIFIPKLFVANLSAPFSISNAHRSTLPLNEQKCRAVNPSSADLALTN
jgi:hypothetical protein